MMFAKYLISGQCKQSQDFNSSNDFVPLLTTEEKHQSCANQKRLYRSDHVDKNLAIHPLLVIPTFFIY